MVDFKVIGGDKKTKARAGILETSHGEILTPVFVPVGTQGTVKSLSCDELSNIGVHIFLANTYHLYLRPGADIVAKLGGLHKFIGWDKPLMTDSGGFQVFSLNRGKTQSQTLKNAEGTISENRRFDQRESALLVKIDDDGVTFRSHLDGSLHRFTPEISIEIQQKLGADIILAFDECPAYGVEKEKVRKAMERTHDWALRSLKVKAAGPAALHPHPMSSVGRHGGLPAGTRWGSPARVTRRLRTQRQLFFGIIQGGVFRDLREESAKFISRLASEKGGFDGIAIGGVAVGESKKEMTQVLDWVTPHLPDEKPRHLLGVGEIDDLFEAVERGIDMFDCVMPTRLGRIGHILTKLKIKNEKLKMTHSTSSGQAGKNERFTIDITKAVFAGDSRSPMEDCGCYTCRNYSRAYLNHLFRSRELLAYHLATYHNLWFITDLMRQMREAIQKGSFWELKKKWLG